VKAVDPASPSIQQDLCSKNGANYVPLAIGCRLQVALLQAYAPQSPGLASDKEGTVLTYFGVHSHVQLFCHCNVMFILKNLSSTTAFQVPVDKPIHELFKDLCQN
jgi:hypothetical protein